MTDKPETVLSAIGGGIGSAMAVVVVGGLYVALITLVPFILIWSLNVLFGLEIEHGFWSYVAAWVLYTHFGTWGRGRSK